MKGHSVVQFGFRRLTPAVQTKKVSHGPQCGVLVARPEPAERIQATAGKMEVHYRTTPEIDQQSGSGTLDHNGAPSVYDDLGGRYGRQHRHQADRLGD